MCLFWGFCVYLCMWDIVFLFCLGFLFLAKASNTELKAFMFLMCSKQMEFLSSSVVVLRITILLLHVLSLSCLKR